MNKEVEAKEIPFENVLILPPKPGVCPVCAVNHNPALPHNKDSLYYQMRFRQENGRFPTWDDAMKHCTQEMKDWFIEEYRKRGIVIELKDESKAEQTVDQRSGQASDC